MKAKVRLDKLEKKSTYKEDEFILIIDDIVHYKGNEYKEEEFYKLYQKFRGGKMKEISWV